MKTIKYHYQLDDKNGDTITSSEFNNSGGYNSVSEAKEAAKKEIPKLNLKITPKIVICDNWGNVIKG